MDARQLVHAASLVREPGVREVLSSQPGAGAAVPSLQAGGVAEPARARADAKAAQEAHVVCFLPASEITGRDAAERIATAVRLGFGEAADRVRTVFAGPSTESLRSAWLSVAADQRVVAAIASAPDEAMARALAELADAAAVPLLLVSPQRVSPGAYARSFGSEQRSELAKLLDYAVDRARLYRFAVLYEDSPAGRQGMELFAAEASRKGAELVAAHGYTAGQEASALQAVGTWRAHRRNVEAVYFSAPSPGVALAAAVQSRFPDLVLFGPAEWGAPAVAAQWRELRVFVPGAQGAGVGDAFDREFEAAAGRPAALSEIRAYRAALLLRRAIVERGAHDREEVRAFLDSLDGLAGVGGEPAVLRVRDGSVEAAS